MPQSARTPTDHVDHCLTVWAVWRTHGNEGLGWSRLSATAHAVEVMLEGGRRDPFGPRVPRIDRAKLGPHVDRLLRDMDQQEGAGAVRHQYRTPKVSQNPARLFPLLSTAE